MTNSELASMKMQLDVTAEKIAGLPPWSAAGELKAAALLASSITVELARRELKREATQ
jgi:hypothetical protein